jgi:hypothetical protein
MTAPNSVRKFEYRPCRIATGFDVDFVAGEKSLRGLCRDVSNSGIRATFDGSIAVGTSGLLVLRHPIGVLKVEAQVAYIQTDQVGLEFIFKTSWESAMTIEYIASIANHAATSLVVRFP